MSMLTFSPGWQDLVTGSPFSIRTEAVSVPVSASPPNVVVGAVNVATPLVLPLEKVTERSLILAGAFTSVRASATVRQTISSPSGKSATFVAFAVRVSTS